MHIKSFMHFHSSLIIQEGKNQVKVLGQNWAHFPHSPLPWSHSWVTRRGVPFYDLYKYFLRPQRIEFRTLGFLHTHLLKIQILAQVFFSFSSSLQWVEKSCNYARSTIVPQSKCTLQRKRIASFLQLLETRFLRRFVKKELCDYKNSNTWTLSWS